MPAEGATRFYYEAHLFKDREGEYHFMFEVPKALGPGLPFRIYSRLRVKRRPMLHSRSR